MLDVALVAAFAMVVALVAPVTGVPGMMHAERQVETCEPQSSMQFVTFDVCASFIAASAAPAPAAQNSAATTMIESRKAVSSRFSRGLFQPVRARCRPHYVRYSRRRPVTEDWRDSASFVTRPYRPAVQPPLV